jgi:hypothetical protein
VISLSGKLAEFAPQLTLDFIPEVSAAMSGMDKTSQRISCIHYMSPWIKNLALFSTASSPAFERSAARLRDCIRVLSELSVTYPEVCSISIVVESIRANLWSRLPQQYRNISGQRLGSLIVLSSTLYWTNLCGQPLTEASEHIAARRLPILLLRCLPSA